MDQGFAFDQRFSAGLEDCQKSLLSYFGSSYLVWLICRLWCGKKAADQDTYHFLVTGGEIRLRDEWFVGIIVHLTHSGQLTPHSGQKIQIKVCIWRRFSLQIASAQSPQPEPDTKVLCTVTASIQQVFLTRDILEDLENHQS
jgi:hypothetical protein